MMVKYLRDIECDREDHTRKLWKLATCGEEDLSPYVVTSSIGSYFGAETMVFWADANGNIVDFDELGSVPAQYSHYGALEAAGIEVI